MNATGKISKKKRFDSTQQQVYLTLWRTYDRLRALEEALFQEWDLTGQQYNVLRLLEGRHPDPMPTLQLSVRLISRAPDITRMLDKLEKRGWIRRERSSTDRRAVLVNITDSGLALIRKLEDAVQEMHVAQVGHLSVSSMRELCRLLDEVRAPHEAEGSDWKP